MQDEGYIVLYNPISQEGHLDSWHVLFADLLLRAGWGVILLTTDLKQLRIKCTQRGLNTSNRFVLLEATLPEQGILSKLRKIVQRIDAYLDTHSIQRSQVRQFFYPIRHIAAGLRKARKNFTVKTWVTHLEPSAFQAHANFAIDTMQDKVLAVFNMYVDAYPSVPVAWKDFSLSRGTPWMGLCITPSHNVTEPYYARSSYRGTCFLDANVCEHYRHTLPNKQFAYLPDITETALPEAVSPLAQEILQRANGRSIVFMGGSIGKQKNLVSWCKLIKLADEGKWFFLQVGRLNKNNLTIDDEVALLDLQAKTPENLFISADYLTDERSFNELIAISNIVFAAYRDFPRSSNMLSKAAEFKKPIIVSDGFLMGERVRRYGIGQVVNQDDVVQMYKALQQCVHLPPTEALYIAYRAEFSENAMQYALDNFMQACLASKGNN